MCGYLVLYFEVLNVEECCPKSGDESRGWAWTRALLGVQASEIHACGDGSSIEVVQRLCEATGDKLVIREYERLSPLVADPQPISSLSNIRWLNVAYTKTNTRKYKV